MFIYKDKRSKLSAGSLTLYMRLHSLCMQVLGLGCFKVWTNMAAEQSTNRLWLKSSPQGATAFPVKRKLYLTPISLDSIIQGCVMRTNDNNADRGFLPRGTLDAQLNYVADRKRAPGDTRPDIADYRTVDLTLRNKNQSDDWGFAFKVLNLFNADAREPSPYATPFMPFSNNVPIPNDLPLAGREWRVELTHLL
jgi:hypothetical protein